MFKVSEIMKILGEIKPYTPQLLNNEIDTRIENIKHQLLKVCICLFLGLLLVGLAYRFVSILHIPLFFYIGICLYIATIIVGVALMTVPSFLEMKSYFPNWRDFTLIDLNNEIAHDENNAKLLLDCAENELLYASHWILKKNNRINTRVARYFGEKTAAISVLGLSFSAMASTIGLDKLDGAFSLGLISLGTFDVFIGIGLIILLGFSLGAIWLKKVSSHLAYLNEIIELAIKMKNADLTEG